MENDQCAVLRRLPALYLTRRVLEEPSLRICTISAGSTMNVSGDDSDSVIRGWRDLRPLRIVQ